MRNKSLKVARLLMERGATIDVNGRHKYDMYSAASDGNLGCMKILFDLRADLEPYSRKVGPLWNHTPFQVAIDGRHPLRWNGFLKRVQDFALERETSG